MAVLNKIRQRSLFLILIIALALFSFVLADLFRNGDALTAKSQNIVATINGKDITRDDFLQKVEIAQKQSGQNATSTQVMNRVWDQEVRQAIMETQFEKLGITVEKDQMRDLLKTALASSPEFMNEAGLFDENKLNEYIINLKETSPAAYASWIDYEKSLAANALQQNYYNMVKAGLTGTLAEGTLEYNLESNKVDLEYVQIPYTSIADSTVKVSNADVKKYVSENKKQYKVDASRDIRYVEFNETVTVEDEAAIKKSLTTLLNDREEYNKALNANEEIVGFRNTKDAGAFVNSNSDLKFDDRFVFKSNLPSVAADSIFNLNVGGMYGPYKDNDYFKISKVIAVTTQPDSVKARHILIPFIGSRSATEGTTMTKDAAKHVADSLVTLFRSNKSKFAEAAKDLSADTGSAANGGDLGYFTAGQMVPEFNDFTFQGKTGDVGVVETIFGYHVIDIQEQKNAQRAIKVATLARKAEPSEETISKVFRDASNFEINIHKKDFDEVLKESNQTARPVNGIKILDENIPGIGNQRPVVRWAFEDGTKVGDVKRFNVSGGYAIVQLVAKHEAGLMAVEEAKATAIPAIRKAKKAKIIRDRVSATTLEDLAKAENTSVKSASAVNMKNPTLSGAGREPMVIGTAFALKAGETSKLVEGNNGVYMVKVTKVVPAPTLDNYQAFANRVESQKVNVVNSKLYNALKEAAEIEDNRARSQVQ
ncbi:SurA N-terminal domain-containing protein [Mariniflexile ostreae]|uniref:Periplasmic chaperone PpiD n=1 Tax=Mariniflexile ostreae TaxID=1520892 RepID=A0ABV5FC04_9FLAO